jgi:hypothetical protein
VLYIWSTYLTVSLAELLRGVGGLWELVMMTLYVPVSEMVAFVKFRIEMAGLVLVVVYMPSR